MKTITFDTKEVEALLAIAEEKLANYKQKVIFTSSPARQLIKQVEYHQKIKRWTRIRDKLHG